MINRQFYTYKFKSCRLKEYNYNINLTFDEAKIFGLPPDDYFPKTIIEIIVSHADKLVNGDELVPFDEACKKLVKKFGKDTLIVKNFHKQKQLIENTKRKKL